MSKIAVVCAWSIAVLCCALAYAQTPDRVTGDLAASPKVQLKGNVHGLARPEFDLGRADGSRLIESITLSLKPSAAQQQDLNNFLAQLGDPHSKSFHKYLTPQQFGERFGMSQNDLDKITAWLERQGFTNISVANGRNQISFDGTVGQIESVFAMEMHDYLVNGEVHLANSGEPSVPLPLAGIVGSLWHINDFSPKPRVAVKPNLTSYVSGNHFLTPGDFAKIYDLGTLYTAGGTGQKIAVIGQSTVNTADLNNFRSAAGLPASTVTMTLVGGTATRCSGDEGESDLDLEWSGGVAQNASVTFVYAGVDSGKTCTSRANNVWNALQYAIQHNVAPFVSTSYGYCESGLGQSFVDTLQSWAQQGQTQGQTIVSASGDSGAADCEPGTSTSATTGLAVDSPASIPEVTGAGGNEFTGDVSECPSTGCTGTTAPADPPYWAASGAGTDNPIVTALEYIPEETWNDTTASLQAGGGLSASGGGASIYFTKPAWQTGTGVPADGHRDVPDISVSASNFHDPYLICSEDDPQTGGVVASCTSGFRTGAAGGFTAVGGTSAAAPTFSAILALINQSLNNPGTTGLAPVNPMLYSLWASTPSAFHDVTQGNNKVPCTAGSTNCPTGTTTIGFSAGAGYDQVSGIGSPDVTNLANAWAATLAQFNLAASALSPTSVAAGSSTTTTITVAPNSGTSFTGTVTLSCPAAPAGVTCSFNPAQVTVPASGNITSTLTIQTAANMAAGTSNLTVAGSSGGASANTTVSLVVTATAMTYTLATNLSGGTATVAQGQTTGAINITVGSNSTPSFLITNGSQQSTALPVTYTCAGNPAQSTCNFTPGNTTSSPTITLAIATLSSTPATSTTVIVTATTGGAAPITSSVQFTLRVIAATPYTTTTALASSANPAVAGSTVTFTATVTTTGPNTPTGVVTFVDGSTTLGIGALNSSGVATFGTSTLSVGQHSIAAMYNGDTNNAASTSAVFSQTINAPDFALSSSPGTATVSAGNSTSITVTVTPQGSFSNSITFACSGLPALASCLFNPASLTPNTNATPTNLTITTAARSGFMTFPPPALWSSPVHAMWFLLTALLLSGTRLPARGRRKLVGMTLLVLLASSLLLQPACGGSGSVSGGGGGNGATNGTPAGTYSVIVTGNAGSVQHTTTLTLTVQ